MIIAAIVRCAKSVTGWRVSKPGLAPVCVVSPAAASVTLDVPHHDPIFPTAVLPSPPTYHVDVPGRRNPALRRMQPPGWVVRMIGVAIAFTVVQLLTAAPGPPTAAAAIVAPVNDPARPYFAIVLVSVNKEPLHELAAGWGPAVFYADGGSCMAATRANVREMAQAGIKGRFLCMYPGESDEALTAGLKENF
jgi:hypothetical protein